MNDQKMDNSLNLAKDASLLERQRSQTLETGYDRETRTWEVIVKYSGSLEAVRALGAEVEEMRNEYAIVTISEDRLDALTKLPQIEYVEQPKRMFFSIRQAKDASCISSLQESGGADRSNLNGRGVLIAIPDSGIDYYHPDFRNADGTTRIKLLWDQVLGKAFTEEEINQALEAGSRTEAMRLLPSVDLSGHGTAVAGIAAGNGSEGGSAYRGVAYESDLLIIRLGISGTDGFPRTTELMRAVNASVEQAVQRRMPLSLNVSFGNSYGSHDGSSLLETFLDDIGNYGKTTITVGSGNEGAAAGHAMGILEKADNVTMTVGMYENSFAVQLWKSYEDQFQVSLRTPSGVILGPLQETLGAQRYRYRNTQILVYYGKPGPYSTSQEIYFDFIPDSGSFVESGEWEFLLNPVKIVRGRYDLWLPGSAVLNPSTRFLRPSPETTLTIPSSADKVITVGAYNNRTRAYADFSGRGYTRLNRQIKPDLTAPGVEIPAPSSGGGYQAVTGTSFAAPFVCGSAALLMQWGIIDGNDPYLYGEKVKAYLRRGARQLPGYGTNPNPASGFGEDVIIRLQEDVLCY